jgi:uncharacterized protein (UPF0332 family)
MALSATEERLQRVSKASKNTLILLKEGVSIESSLSRQMDDVMAQTVADRLDLADEFLDMAERLYRSKFDMSRPAIARYYYAMYHAMRAASFQSVGGDDHEQHTALSVKGIPDDYPNKALASNELKDARSLRNEADYEQYPITRSYFQSAAKNLRPVAKAFVSAARQYVTSKGNPHS